MKPAFILQIFRRTGALLTPTAWSYIGGFIAGALIVSTLIIRCH